MMNLRTLLKKMKMTSGWTKENTNMKKQEIKTGMFCTVDTSDFCQYGVKRGNLVYVYGEFMSRVCEDDPYAFRKLFIATKTKERHVVDSNKPFTIDGSKLTPVKKAAQERLQKLLEEDYKQEES